MKENNIYTFGIDVGGSYIKAVLLSYSDNSIVVDKISEKVRKRDPSQLSDDMVNLILTRNGLTFKDISYLASTGEGEMVNRKTGHFYSMTTHSKGGLFLNPAVLTVVDMGALYVRAIKINNQGRVLDYKMTGQCASGSGQFIENISRYLGLAIEEVGEISLGSKNPETPSGICAVLAETDVINMVSRGISTPNIIKGIHLSIANRVVKLLSSLKADSPIMLTGGMALNKGMVQAIKELAIENKYDWEIFSDPDSIYAGAIGAALWSGYRFQLLNKKNSKITNKV